MKNLQLIELWDTDGTRSFTVSEMLECYELDAASMERVVYHTNDKDAFRSEAQAFKTLRYWASLPYSVRHAH